MTVNKGLKEIYFWPGQTEVSHSGTIMANAYLMDGSCCWNEPQVISDSKGSKGYDFTVSGINNGQLVIGWSESDSGVLCHEAIRFIESQAIQSFWVL